jgi:hypothetical protein
MIRDCTDELADCRRRCFFDAQPGTLKRLTALMIFTFAEQLPCPLDLFLPNCVDSAFQSLGVAEIALRIQGNTLRYFWKIDQRFVRLLVAKGTLLQAKRERMMK